MNALAHDFDLPQSGMPAASPTQRGSPSDPLLLEDRWEALHQAADAVARLAQLGREGMSAANGLLVSENFPHGEPREQLARGIDDLAAVMQTGLRALLGVIERGNDATAAAVTLWREFHVGREAIRALARTGTEARSPG